MLPLRQPNIISQIEKNTNFEYNIGDGDSIGGNLGDLEKPIYIDPRENDYHIYDMNVEVKFPNWENEAEVAEYFNNPQDGYHAATIEEVIQVLNQIEKSHK